MIKKVLQKYNHFNSAYKIYIPNYSESNSRNAPKLSSKYLKENMQNQTIFELYTDDSKSKYSSNPKDILKSAKIFMENSTTSKLRQLQLLNFSGKFLTERKYLMNTLILVRWKYL